MSGIEGLGEAVTGGMMARAVEPETGLPAPAGAAKGEAEDHHPGACLNCGTALIGDYCHHCGQTAHIHRSLAAFWHDLAHGVLHFEGKIWRTLPMLAFRPGELTRRYIAGERARFVSPMALFLFSVFLMVAVFHSVGGPFSAPASVKSTISSLDALRNDIAENRADLAQAQQELGAAKAAGESTASEEEKVSDLKVEIAAKEQALRVASAVASTGGTVKTETKVDVVRADDAIKQMNFKTDIPTLDHAIKKAQENPDLLIYKLQSNAYKFSWALIPISVPLVWLLFFWKRRFKLYDHTVFVTYSISAMSLGLIILSLLRPLGLPAKAVENSIAFLPPLHMFAQLKGAYALGIGGALWRTFFLLMFAFIAGTFFFLVLLGLGAMD